MCFCTDGVYGWVFDGTDFGSVFGRPGGYIFEIPALSLTVSAMFVLLMSGLILYQTSDIIRGGEANNILWLPSLSM